MEGEAFRLKKNLKNLILKNLILKDFQKNLHSPPPKNYFYKSIPEYQKSKPDNHAFWAIKLFYKEDFVYRFSAVVLTAAAAAMFAVGCGGGSNNGLGLKEGDKLIVTQALERERFEASYGESVKKIDHTDGDIIEIPEGTVLEVFVTPKSDAKSIEVRPVKSGDVTDEEALKAMFVSERFRTPDFLYYTISLKSDYLGTKIKKME
jgi:hypothetical protein